MQTVICLIHWPFKNNLYTKGIVIVHLTHNISFGSHEVTTLGVILNNTTQHYFGLFCHNHYIYILPQECVWIVNVTH